MALWCDFMAGWISGMGGLIVGHPMDSIKVSQQINGTKLIQATKNAYQSRGLLVGLSFAWDITINLTDKLISNDRFQGFYRGMAAPLLSNGALNSLYFGFYNGTLDILRETKTKNGNAGVKGGKIVSYEPTYLDHYVAGCIGGCAQLVLACPVDLVKVQLQGTISISSTHAATLRGPLDCIVKLVEANGPFGLYKGLTSQAIRDIPSAGVYFFMYEFGKNKFAIRGENSKVACFMAGGIAGMVSWWSILPLDVIKSRIQSDCPQNPQYKGILHCVRHIYRNEGIRGFFRGFMPLSIRAFPVNGTTFVIYEYLHTHCRDKFDNNYDLL